MNTKQFIEQMTPAEKEAYLQRIVTKAQIDVNNNTEHADAGKIILELQKCYERYQKEIKELQLYVNDSLNDLKGCLKELAPKIDQCCEETQKAFERVQSLANLLNC